MRVSRKRSRLSTSDSSRGLVAGLGPAVRGDGERLTRPLAARECAETRARAGGIGIHRPGGGECAETRARPRVVLTRRRRRHIMHCASFGPPAASLERNACISCSLRQGGRIPRRLPRNACPPGEIRPAPPPPAGQTDPHHRPPAGRLATRLRHRRPVAPRPALNGARRRTRPRRAPLPRDRESARRRHEPPAAELLQAPDTSDAARKHL